MLAWLMIAGGLIALTFGADLLVKGASTLAARLGVPTIVIGLTVVAFGTSAPEMAVSVSGAWKGQAAIAVGNVLGSNLFNILVILGLSALILPLVVHQQVVRVEVPIMFSAAVLTYFFCQDGKLNFIEGLLTFGLLGVYILYQIRNSLREGSAPGDGEVEIKPNGNSKPWRDFFYILAGLGLLVFGADRFVEGAVQIARSFGVSELVIGLTIVAVGTSLPEVATSVVAAFRKQADIAVGNVVGSNIFNSLGVLGLAGTVSPDPVEVSAKAVTFDFPLTIAVSLLCFPLFLRGLKIGRLEGIGFVLSYAAYVMFLILDQLGHPLVKGKQAFVVQWAFPAVALLLIIYASRELFKNLREDS
ncbi:MAG: calcium/sodium antiporter [Bdellovibrionaceae bacterium]|nr:calcium/sodium antiporter [Pseudobdellovibrionaceae bacterium]